MGRRPTLIRVRPHERVVHWLKILAEAGATSELRADAQEILDHGAKEDDLAMAIRGARLSLLGEGKDMGPAERARYHDIPQALRRAVLYHVGEEAPPPPIYLGTGSGWSFDDGNTGLAWSPSSGVCPDADRRVRLSWRPKELPYQLDLELDL